jgi:hypothetical protein
MKIKSQSKGGGTAPTSKRVMGNKVAGGIGSRVVNPQGIRDGQKAFPVSPRGVSQIGSAIGNKVTAEVGGKINYRGEPWLEGKPPISVPLGNELAKNVGKGGCGTGRQVMARGSQSTYGTPASGNPQPKGELFPGWPAKR